MNNEHIVYKLEMTPTGRIVHSRLASFTNNPDALHYATVTAFKRHINTLVVYPSGNVTIHSEHA
jgi:hypothetical protein